MKFIAVKVFQLKQLKKRNLKKVSSFQLLKLKHLHCDDLHIILSISAVQIYDYFIYIPVHFSIYRINTNSQLTSSQLA